MFNLVAKNICFTGKHCVHRESLRKLNDSFRQILPTIRSDMAHLAGSPSQPIVTTQCKLDGIYIYLLSNCFFARKIAAILKIFTKRVIFRNELSMLTHLVN